jgi:hypothetical protein
MKKFLIFVTAESDMTQIEALPNSNKCFSMCPLAAVG